VTAQNAHEYVQEVLDLILGKGAQLQARAFREGFSKVFPISDLQPFSVEELVMLFGNGDEDWSIESEPICSSRWIEFLINFRSIERSAQSRPWFPS
jgi:hypothetical protein